MSVLFTASDPYLAGWTVSIGSQVLPVVHLEQVNPNASLYGVDVSAFAGKMEQLSFTALSGSSPGVTLFLDNVYFSSSMVPEPSALALVALGCGSLLFLRRK